jgi:hypothetical protein
MMRRCLGTVSENVSRRRLRLVLPLALCAAAGLAVVADAASPTGLAAGKAKGTLTVNGKTAAMTHAYAGLEPNPFDAKLNDIVVLLTDQPLDAASAAGALSDATGLKNYLRLKLREDPNMAKAFGFMDRWVVGNRTLGHEVLKEQALQSSPDFGSKVDAVVVGPDRVEGTIYTAGAQESLDVKFEYRISFNAAVKPRASGE